MVLSGLSEISVTSAACPLNVASSCPWSELHTFNKSSSAPYCIERERNFIVLELGKKHTFVHTNLLKQLTQSRKHEKMFTWTYSDNSLPCLVKHDAVDRSQVT